MSGTRADLDRDPNAVARMFDGVAARYDLTNTVLSFAQDVRWRRATREALAVGPGDTVLDVAAGTGVSTVELARTGARCLATDFSLGMLRTGRSRPATRGLPFVAADALHLPFPDASVDAVVISFGLRNTVDPDAALAEFARVTRPGGTLAVCEFSRPTWAPFRRVYTDYLMRALPRVATAVSSNPDAYVYLAESIRAWPDQAALAQRIAAAGWRSVAWRDLTGGIVALHTATRPE
ncbi:demethylmenaquinone methyltransferase [Actinomycetospora straminea]|uniref:Demethylmenaquinone methyltransferase n=1 Tax=Actinomycetospora straminea TaxID=663607 RepID=A0ABP9E308_9PSEU|nr:demethylmenaquinone methyltransferase [Actinomycetospora straminea]MDD7931415.1 demethylmenaquinone methyltransferase [Actinomycetospora straminea]